MKLHFYVELKGDIDTLMLWGLIEKYKINLTALEDTTWIYGDVHSVALGEIMAICSLFGDYKAEVHHV